jgi:hypothetical protein
MRPFRISYRCTIETMFVVRFCSRLKKYVSIERIIDCERLYIGVKEISILYLPAYDISMTDCQSVANISRNPTCEVLLRNLACGQLKRERLKRALLCGRFVISRMTKQVVHIFTTKT